MAKNKEVKDAGVNSTQTNTTNTNLAWPRIYIGPSIPKGYLQNNMIFADGYPEPVKNYIKEHASVARLIVATKDYAKSVAQLNVQGSLLNNARNQLFKEISKGVK